jgi:hypothetical protein
MKFVKFSIVALLMPVIFLSCSKDKDDAVLPVEGNWNGLYGNDNDPPSMSYKLNIKHGGVIEEVNGADQVKGSGNWSFNGNTLTAHYQWKAPLNTVFSIIATYDPATNKLTGTWGFDNSATDGGKWEANKTN